MNRLMRILKHRWRDERDLRRTLSQADLDRLEAEVAASERGHSGEIRICVEAGLPLSYLWRGASARERAVAMFGKLGVWDTEHNNGVLIYLLLAERQIEIVVDRGLARQVDTPQWQAVIAGMADSFRSGAHAQGLSAAVQAVDGVLRQHFPLAADRPNPDELPNRPVLR